MPSFDVRKIITSFLVLSIAAGMVAFIFSSLSLPSAPAEIQNITAEASAPDSPTVGTSTLQAESLPDSAFADVFSTSTAAIDSSSTNLTDRIADSLAQVIVQDNPNGPQTDDSGNQTVAVPSDLSDMVLQQLTDSSMSFVSVPLQEDKIKVTKDYASDDVISYLRSVEKIVQDTYVNDGIGKLSKSPSDINTDTIAAVNLVLSQAEEKLYALTVPAPLQKVDRAILSFVTYQMNVFSPALDSDPARSLALVQNYDTGIQLRANDIKTEMDSISKNIPSLIPVQKTGLLENIFLPKTAYAGFFDDAANYITSIETTLTAFFTGSSNALQVKAWVDSINKFLKALLLSIFRQQIIHRMVLQTINWINGNGSPQFITNWDSFLNDAGTNAANTAISSLNDLTHGQLCSSFGPLITLQLKQQYLNGLPPPTCTIDRIINNVDNFYNSFENGGWIAFGALSSPSGNYYGSMMQAQISVQNKIAAAKGNANSNAVANKGFPGQKVCVVQGTMTVHHDATLGTAGTPAIAPHDIALPNGTVFHDPGSPGTPGTPGGLAYDSQDASPNAPCAQFQTLTPGGTVAFQLDNALGSNITNIISAQDIAALFDAMINSAMQKLVKFSTTGLTGLLKGDQNTPASPVVATENTDPCVGLTGDELDQCKGITGTTKLTTGSSTDILSQKTDLSSAVQADIQTLQDTQGADTNWLLNATDTETAVLQVAAACNTSTIATFTTVNHTSPFLDLSDSAIAAAQSIENTKGAVQDELTSINPISGESCDDPQSWTKKFSCLEGDIISSKSADDLQLAITHYDDYKAKSGGILQRSGVVRYEQLQALKRVADADIAPSTLCQVPLPLPQSSP
jgi:hypothetical protein